MYATCCTLFLVFHIRNPASGELAHKSSYCTCPFDSLIYLVLVGGSLTTYTAIPTQALHQETSTVATWTVEILSRFTLLYDLVPISGPPLLQKNTQDVRSAPG